MGLLEVHMARWDIHTDREGCLEMTYHNLQSGTVQKCGKAARGTPSRAIVQWIMNQGGGREGDVIRFDDGSIFFVSPGSVQEFPRGPEMLIPGACA